MKTALFITYFPAYSVTLYVCYLHSRSVNATLIRHILLRVFQMLTIICFYIL